MPTIVQISFCGISALAVAPHDAQRASIACPHSFSAPRFAATDARQRLWLSVALRSAAHPSANSVNTWCRCNRPDPSAFRLLCLCLAHRRASHFLRAASSPLLRALAATLPAISISFRSWLLNLTFGLTLRFLSRRLVAFFRKLFLLLLAVLGTRCIDIAICVFRRFRPMFLLLILFRHRLTPSALARQTC